MDLYVDIANEHGYVHYSVLGPFTALFVQDPDVIKDVFRKHHSNYIKSSDMMKQILRPLLGYSVIMSEGPLWKRQRKLLAPVFHHEQMRQMTGIVSSICDRFVDKWSEEIDQSKDGFALMEMNHALSELTLDIVATAAFGPTFIESDEVNRVVHDAFSSVLQDLHNRAEVMIGWLPFVRDIPTPGQRRIKKGCAAIENVVRKVIQDRQQGLNKPESGRDLLDMLLEAAFPASTLHGGIVYGCIVMGSLYVVTDVQVASS